VRKCADHNRSGRFMQQLPSQFWKRSELSQKKALLSLFAGIFLSFDRIKGIKGPPSHGKEACSTPLPWV
jgi:hypothetical protein